MTLWGCPRSPRNLNNPLRNGEVFQHPFVRIPQKGELVGRKLIVIDPRTGRQMVIYQQPQVYPMQEQPYYPMQPVPQYRPPVPYRPRKKRGKEEPRVKRASMASGYFLIWCLGWIPCAYGYPGGTWLVWALMAAHLLYRLVR